MSELLLRAFGALGKGPTWRELQLVANTVRDSGDEEAIGLLNAATDLGEPYEELVKLAEASGSGPFVALNFLTEYSSPEAHTTLRERERTSDS